MSPIPGGAVSPNHRQPGIEDSLPSNVVDQGQNVERPPPPSIPAVRDPTVVEKRPRASVTDTNVLGAIGVGVGVLAVGGGVLAYKAVSASRAASGHVRLPTSHVSDSSRGDSVPRSYMDDRFEIGSFESDSVGEPVAIEEPAVDTRVYRQWGNLRRRHGLGFVGAGVAPGLANSDLMSGSVEFSDSGSQTDFTPSIDASVQAVASVIDNSTSATLNIDLAEIDSGMFKHRGYGLYEYEEYVNELLEEIADYKLAHRTSSGIIESLTVRKRDLDSQVVTMSQQIDSLNSQISLFQPTRAALEDMQIQNALLNENFLALQDRYIVAEQHIEARNSTITSLERQLRRRPPRFAFR